MFTHEYIGTRLAHERAETARAQAAARRLRVAAGVDLHTRVVSALGVVVDRLRAGDARRRTRAAQAPVRPVTDPIGAVRPA